MWRKNVANTCVVEWPPGQLLALWEMGPPHALDAETLRTTKSWSHLEYLATSDCALSRLRPLLAHTKTWTDGDASTLVGLSALGSSYTFYEFGLDGALASSTEATMPLESSIVHDFAITEDYYVVQENPVVYTGDVGPRSARRPCWERVRGLDAAATPPPSCPAGRRDRTLVFDTGDHALAFHFANAYQDDDGSVVVVAASFDNYRMGSEYGFDPVEGTFAPAQLLEHDHEAGPFLFETRLDVAAGLERGEGTLRGLATRTPRRSRRTATSRPRTRREGRKTRYAYCAASPHLADGDPFFPFHSVQKVDVAGGGPALSWAPERPGCFVGEPVSAPRPGGSDEDDGWLLVLVHDVPNDATELAVLSARNLALVAELRSSGLLPLGLHGSWSPAP
ncbi:oxidoreductase [Aureococcus anophagefferens]|nr:oxidoreductase [Aureococcus anophagefferens]